MIGGQALIEGVMMRSPRYVGVAVRNSKGNIVTKANKLPTPHPFWKLSFFRGIYVLVSMLVVGIRELNWSASQATEEEETISDWLLYLTLFISLVFGIGLFVFVPYALTTLIGVHEEYSPFLFNFIDGSIKVLILLAYVYGISFWDDVKRLYQYHGAEHMTVFCYEHEQELTVKNVKKFSTLHPRCGTSFLFVVILMSVLIFSFTPLLAQLIFPSFSTFSFLLRRVFLFALRLGFLPLVAGLSYEFLKWSSRFAHHNALRIFVVPGLLLQRITTRKPDDKQIEIAISSLKEVLKAEGQKL